MIDEIELTKIIERFVTRRNMAIIIKQPADEIVLTNPYIIVP